MPRDANGSPVRIGATVLSRSGLRGATHDVSGRARGAIMSSPRPFSTSYTPTISLRVRERVLLHLLREITVADITTDAPPVSHSRQLGRGTRWRQTAARSGCTGAPFACDGVFSDVGTNERAGSEGSCVPLSYEGADESHRFGENSRARELHCTHIPPSPVILSVLRMFITATETRKRLCAPAGDSVPASLNYGFLSTYTPK